MTNPQCECENEQQSEFSPGLVSDDEAIVFGLIDPDTYRNGLADLSKSKLKGEGVSVCRAKYVSAAAARSSVLDSQLKSNPLRRDEGIAYLLCSQIREINLVDPKTRKTTDVRAFCVKDDAYEDFKAHAHVAYGTHPEKWMGNARVAAWMELHDALKKAPRCAWDEGPFAER